MSLTLKHSRDQLQRVAKGDRDQPLVGGTGQGPEAGGAQWRPAENPREAMGRALESSHTGL